MGRDSLSNVNRIKALKEKHAAADAEIQLLQLLPSDNQGKIRELKKRKLKMKDEIVRLENPYRLTAPKKNKQKKGVRPTTSAQKIPVHEVDTVSISEESTTNISRAA
ncbi:YdcH family protein [Patescibacteria group bacterium]|nr:YdcH family protein [Patescibacteria group bacterium]